MEAKKNIENLVNQFEENLVKIKTDMIMESAGLQVNERKFYIVEKDLIPRLNEIEETYRHLKVKEQMDIDDLRDEKKQIQTELAKLNSEHHRLKEDFTQMQNQLMHIDELKKQIVIHEKKQEQLIEDNQKIQKEIWTHQSNKEQMINQTNEEVAQMRIKAKIQASDFLKRAEEEKQLMMEETKKQMDILTQKTREENQKIREGLALEFKNSVKSETSELVTILSRWFFTRYYSNQSNQEAIVSQIKREFEEMVLSVLDKRKNLIDEKVNTDFGVMKKIFKKLWPL